jgi:hypothetical protein
LKSLDEKLARIIADPSGSKDFIIADAKDADMAFGIAAPGPEFGECKHPYSESVGCWKSLEDYRNQIRDVIRQGIIDIMLLSASNVEKLGIEEKLFENSPITPAARANDTSDIWVIRGGSYPKSPSRSFRSATIEHIKYGRLNCNHSDPVLGSDLGLYSVTFTNDLEWDHRSLQEFYDFRLEAEKKNFRDHIIRCLAGVTNRGRPLFLKIPYHGPAALEELVAYDPNLIVGILGGSAGTTYDAFKLIHDAQKHGARIALFGRKINLSEHPLTFIEMLRRIVEGEVTPEEAVKAYHGVLQRLKIKPFRSLNRDLVLSKNKLSYG